MEGEFLAVLYPLNYCLDFVQGDISFCAAGFFTLSYFFESSEGICIIFLALCALEDHFGFGSPVYFR